ncbi:MAG: hypothetical protein PHO27_00840 [Sulfuricurvum sp.]|nr:hypothetical protein [Sulfuricurvum sp.]
MLVSSTYTANSTYKSPPELQNSSQPTTGYVDKVTISDEAKALLATENNSAPTQQRTYAQERLLQAASSDQSSAAQIASGMANTPSTIFFNISDQAGVGDGKGEFVRKLSSTGEIVDEDYVTKFNKEASAIDTQRRLIYDTEKAKGTDPLKILEKMIDFTNKQSQGYLDATGWGWQGSTPPA